MPTSGSWNYSVTASDIITAALEDLGVLQSGGTVDSSDMTVALRTLNLLVKQWQGRSDKFPGLKVWTRQRVVMFLVPAQSRFLIGPASTDDRASANSLATVLGAAKAADATSVSLASTAGMSAADIIGFLTDAGTLGWSTIGTVVNSTSVAIGTNTISAAASGKVVYSYTSKAQRFVDIEAASLRDNSTAGNPIDSPLDVYTEVADYESLPQKQAVGDPTAILVEPQRLNTAVTLDSASSNLYRTLRLTVIYPAEDYDTSADDIAYPQEYYAALEWELARRLAPKFEVEWTAAMKENWQIAVQEGINLNPDNTSVHFQPGRE